jgi:integrase
MARKRAKRGFGQTQKLPSGRWRARYTGPDMARHSAPHTFEAREDAEAWLVAERRLATADGWTPPKARRAAESTTFGDYAESWLRRRDLKPRTRALYRSLLDRLILPTFKDRPLAAITPRAVSEWWHDDLDPKKPTQRAHAYQLLTAIMKTAAIEDEIAANPCRVRGGSQAKRVKQIGPATLDELAKLVEAMPEKYRTMTLLAAWCGLRFGELAALRRSDLDLKNGVVRVRRAVVHVGGQDIESTPKSDAGVRDVAIPPHLIDVIRRHRDTYAQFGREGLLFPAADGESHLAGSTLHRAFRKARASAGRPDLRFHDLRHTGAVLAASTGATLAELMSRLGHSTPSAALRYQHAAEGRDKAIAKALSALVGP